MKKGEVIIIPKVWRSELSLIILFFIFCLASIVLSHEFPRSVIKGELFSLGSSKVMLHLPLFWLLPAGTLGRALFKIYNVRYILDKNGIEGRYGVLWVNQVISRIRYVDIRSAEIQQSLADRLLTVGDVIISSAAKQTIDILFQGIAVPHEVKEVILAERDKRQRLEHLNMKAQSSVKEQVQA